MILNDLLSSDGFTPVNKRLAKDLGFVVSGYLGELIRQRKRFGAEEFYFSQHEMTDEVGLSAYEQRTALKILIAKGFVSVEKRGMPSRYFYRIDDYAVLQYLNHQGLKNCSTSDEKFEAHNKNENKNNNNIILYTEEIAENDPIDLKLKKTLSIFILNRKKMKKPMNEFQIAAFQKKLESLSGGNPEIAIAILNESIANGWQGIFPLKQTRTNSDLFPNYT